MPYEGEWAYNQRHDFRHPRVLVQAYDADGVLADISGRLISMSVTMNASYAADTFSAKFSNADGGMLGFTHAKEMQISATFDQFEQEKLISGRIGTPKMSFSKSGGAVAELSGKDWIAELQNVIVIELYKKGTFTAGIEPYVGEIIRDLVSKYASTIDASGVPDTTVQIDYKLFANLSVYDAIRFLADIINYRFYVNADRELIFEPIPEPILVQDAFSGSGDPSGWTEQSGDWAQVGGRYKQATASGSFTTTNDQEFDDVLVDCKVIIDSGTRAGVALGVDGAGNHYFVALDMDEGLIKIYSVAAWTGAEVELKVGAPLTELAFGAENHLRIYAKAISGGTRVLAYVGNMNHSVLSYDIAAALSGKVGFRTEDAVAFFDDFLAANAYLVIEEGFNAEDISIQTELDRQKNRIRVRGGYEKFPVEEVITPSGSTTDISLSYLPSETKVTVTGASGNPQKGGIFGIDDLDPTVYFVVDYFGKRLIRTGGLNWTAAVTTIDYNKNVPLIGQAEDGDSFEPNGVRDYVHTDKLLNTQALVDARAQALLDKLKDVPRSGDAKVPGAVWLVNPGDYVLVRSPSNGVADWEMMKAETITVSFSKSDGLTYSFTLDNESASLPLLLNSIEQRLKKLEQRDISEALVRIENYYETATVQDAITGESNDVSAALKLGYYAKPGYNRKLGNASAGWGAAF